MSASPPTAPFKVLHADEAFHADLSGGLRRRWAWTIAAAMIGLAVTMTGCSRDQSLPPAVATQDSDVSANSSAASSSLPTEATALEQLRVAVEKGDWSQAQRLVQAAMIVAPDSEQTYLLAARVEGSLGNAAAAADHMSRAVLSSRSLTSSTLRLAIQAHMQAGQLYEAIEMLETLASSPEMASSSIDLRAEVYRLLVGLWGEAGQGRRADRWMQKLIEARKFDAPLLVSVTDQTQRLFSLQAVEMMASRNPTDRRLRFPQAQVLLQQSQTRQAIEVLQEMVNAEPSFKVAVSMLGRLLAAQPDTAAYREWRNRWVPQNVAESPLADEADYWFALATEPNADRQPIQQLRCLLEAGQRRPNDVAVWQRVTASLQEHNSLLASDIQQPLAIAAQGRVATLLELRDHLFRFSASDRTDSGEALEVAQRLFQLGRYWEAEAWSAISLSLSENAELVNELRKPILSGLAADSSWQSKKSQPLLAFDRRSLPLPTSKPSDELATSIRSGTQATGDSRIAHSMAMIRPDAVAGIRMQDKASSIGLRFFGRVGDRAAGPFVPLSQTVGCGGAAIDFDRAGGCDLAIAAADTALHGRDGQPNALFRHLGSEMTNVAQVSGADDRGYGQGVAAGDFNDDGWPDLWLMNLGGNRLLRNNGDGTFSDCTADVLSMDDESRWSTSGAIVDLDQDGFCDLVSLTYADAESGIEQPCFENDREVACHPLQFPADANQFWQGRGNGTFESVSEAWTRGTQQRLALGLLAGRFDEKNMQLWIANDMMANELFTYQTNTNPGEHDVRSGDLVRSEKLVHSGYLLDNAAVAGVSVDARALTQASMGITASDMDRDGDLDVYITGFAREYNVLHQQTKPGLWSDRTSSLRLGEPTLNQVGFGCQSLDLDGDGWDELLISNGHIGDFGEDAPPYAQPMQVFRRQPSGEFAEMDVRDWGDYFTRPHVGRAMISLDLDGNGSRDAVVTHLTEPVAALINTAPTSTQWIAFELVARRGPRDAVGARVVMQPDEASEPTLTLHRFTGGYLTTNEPILRAGIGSAGKVTDVMVHWPDGSIETLGTLDAGRCHLVVQDAGVVDSLPFRSRRDSIGNE